MKSYFTIILLIITAAAVASAQPGDWNVKTFGDDTLGYYQNNANWEETVYLRPEATGLVKKIFIYLTGTIAARDTVFISGDPAESGYPPSLFVRKLNTYAEFIINYDGEPKWYEFDVSDLKIISSPIKPILVQHLIKSGGPFFLMDKKQDSPTSSYINDVFNPRPDFYNLMGLRASLTQGDYYAAMKINYDIETVPTNSFTDVTISAGLVNESGEPLKQPMASVVDFDMDGWDDVVISGYLFRNMQDGSFKLHSKPFNPNPAGTTWGDLNNDGFVDVFTVNGMGNDKIYWGSLSGDFIEKTPTDVVFNQPTVTPMFLDYNSDGLLDIYIAFGRRTVNNQEVYYPDKLLKNLGAYDFIDVTSESKIAAAEAGNPHDTWGASVCDFNNDSHPDIFVANYRLQPDFLFENAGDGTFYEAAKEFRVHGVPTADPQYFGHGMGSDWGDFDNDGDQDLAVGNLAHFDSRGLYSNKSLILRNDGNFFEDVTDEMRLGFYEMNGGIVWADLNNDSWLDIVHGQISYNPRGKDSDRLTRIYLNTSEDNDFRLQDITYESGVDLHGAWCPIRFDFDKDGDMDLLIASNLENVKLYRNDMPQKGKYLNFFLKGAPENAGVNLDAYGSKVEVTHKDKTYTRWLARFIPGALHKIQICCISASRQVMNLPI